MNEKSCVACNACVDVCAVRVRVSLTPGLPERRAIYIPFPQAVPNTYLVDETELYVGTVREVKHVVPASKNVLRMHKP